ncbi:MAG: thioredoxin [Candidatus Obscuribacterales bacterium]|nr:thioredoxin [Candidatus Obscuribacterales bacterium]
MRDALIAFFACLVIGAIINGSHGPAVSHVPESLQQSAAASRDADLVPAVTQASFDSDVLQSEKPVLVEFWATWCDPCKRMKPVVNEIAKEFEEQIKTVKVDIDAEPELAGKFNVNGVPTLMLFKDGKMVTIVSGVTSKETLAEQINRVL